MFTYPTCVLKLHLKFVSPIRWVSKAVGLDCGAHLSSDIHSLTQLCCEIHNLSQLYSWNPCSSSAKFGALNNKFKYASGILNLTQLCL